MKPYGVPRFYYGERETYPKSSKVNLVRNSNGERHNCSRSSENKRRGRRYFKRLEREASKMTISESIISIYNSIESEAKQESSVETFINNIRTTEDQRINNKKLYQEYKKVTDNPLSTYLQFEEELLEVDGVFKDKGFFIIEGEQK